MLGHRKVQMPVGARFGEVKGSGDTSPVRRPLSEGPKPPGSWLSVLELSRSFFFPKAGDLGTTSLAGYKTILVGH